MSTYAELRSQIEDEIYDSTITTSVNKAILDAIKFYARKKFWFNQKTGTFNTVASQEYYGDSDNSDISGIIEILSMTAGSLKTKVDPIPFETIDAWQDGGVVGQPQYFAYFAEQIRLYPIPDQVYPVTMAYHYRFPELSGDSDTNPWTTDAEELIRTRAKRTLALHKLWDVEMYARLLPAEQEAYSALQSETAKRRSVKSLVTDYPTHRRGFDIRVG